jgi:hypothetical protein
LSMGFFRRKKIKMDLCSGPVSVAHGSGWEPTERNKPHHT